MSKKGYIALSLGPDGLSGCRALRDEHRSLIIEENKCLAWEGPPGQDLTGHVEAIRRLITDLKGKAKGPMRGLVCLHPSWVLVRKVPVPKASGKEVEEYLQLQVRKQEALLGSSDVGWGHLPVDDTDTLLTLCKRETLGPIEQAFADSGVRLTHVTISSVGVYSLLKAHDAFANKGDHVVLKLGDKGAELLEVTAGRVADFTWLPYPSDSGGEVPRLDLLARKLASRIDDLSGKRIVVCGALDKRAEVLKHLSALELVEEFDGTRQPSGLKAGSNGARTAWLMTPEELVGLLLQEVGPQQAELNFINAKAALPNWTDRVEWLFDPKKAVPLAVAAVLLLALTTFGGRYVENRMYAGALDKTYTISRGVERVKSNVDLLKKYRAERTSTLDVVHQITQALPNGVLLTHLDITKKGDVILMGSCGSFVTAEELVINLNKATLLERAKTERVSKGKKKLEFRVKCKLKQRRRTSS